MVAVALIAGAGHQPGTTYGKRGLGYIKSSISRFNEACRMAPYLALADFMDTRCSCPPEVVSNWLPHKSPRMLFRLAVNELESWLMADRVGLGKFLGIDPMKLPARPEQLSDPKRFVVNLARRSKSPKIQAALVPPVGSTAQVGRLYTSEMKRFVRDHWDRQAARINAPSLDRCLRSLEALS